MRSASWKMCVSTQKNRFQDTTACLFLPLPVGIYETKISLLKGKQIEVSKTTIITLCNRMKQSRAEWTNCTTNLPLNQSLVKSGFAGEESRWILNSRSQISSFFGPARFQLNGRFLPTEAKTLLHHHQIIIPRCLFPHSFCTSSARTRACLKPVPKCSLYQQHSKMINMLRGASTTPPLRKLKEHNVKSRTCHPSWIKNDFTLGDYLEGCHVHVLCIVGHISPPQTFITFISIV